MSFRIQHWRLAGLLFAAERGRGLLTAQIQDQVDCSGMQCLKEDLVLTLLLMFVQADNENDNELDDLDAEADMPIEELLAK